jgi:uncharacterized integral membrane protein
MFDTEEEMSVCVLETTMLSSANDMIYLLLTAIGLTPSGNSIVHIYTQTIHRTTQLIWEECWPCPVFASYTLTFALQPR